MFGKITRLTIDLIAISTVLAGVKKSTGFAFQYSKIKDISLRRFFESYFTIGETVFGFICGFVINSDYFKRIE